MTQTNYTVPTVYGRNQNAKAQAGQTVPAITHIVFGDGVRQPTGGETALLNVVHTATLSDSGVYPDQTAAWFECYLGPDIGGFVIREHGLLDADGNLVAIGVRDPGVPKADPQSGAADDFTYRIDVLFDAVDAINVQVDPLHGIGGGRRVDTGTYLTGGGALSQDLLLDADIDAIAAGLGGFDADQVDGYHAADLLDLGNATGALGRANLPDSIAYTNEANVFSQTQTISGAMPQLHLRDNNVSAHDFWFRADNDRIYILTDRDGDGFDETPNPLELRNDAGTAFVYGNRILTTADEGHGNNLVADMVDGQHAADLLDLGNATGTLPDARLSGNVPLLDAAAEFADEVRARTLFASRSDGEGGGRIHLQRPETNTSLTRDVYFDVLRDRIRIVSDVGSGPQILTLDLASAAGQIIHTGNDGDGCGFDADLLDGHDGSYYRDLGNATGSLLRSRIETQTAGSVLGRAADQGDGPVQQLGAGALRDILNGITGLDADLLDGEHGDYYLDLGNATGVLDRGRIETQLEGTFLGRAIGQGTGAPQQLNAAAAIDILNTASGLDADRLDGQHGAYYLDCGNATGTLADARLTTNVVLRNADWLPDIDNARDIGSNTLRFARGRFGTDLMVGEYSTNPAISADLGARITPGRLSAYNDSGPCLELGSSFDNAAIARFRHGNTSSTAVVGSITVTDGTTTYNTTSDRRLKDRIETLPAEEAGAVVDALAPSRFVWRSSGRGDWGFVADEAQAVLPQIVQGEPDGEEMQTMDASAAPVIAALVRTVQDLRERVADLERRVDTAGGDHGPR